MPGVVPVAVNGHHSSGPVLTLPLRMRQPCAVLECRKKWGLKRWGLKQIGGCLRFLRFPDFLLFGPSGKGRAISRKGGQTPLKPQFVTPAFVAAQQWKNREKEGFGVEKHQPGEGWLEPENPPCLVPPCRDMGIFWLKLPFSGLLGMGLFDPKALFSRFFGMKNDKGPFFFNVTPPPLPGRPPFWDFL